MKRSDFLKTVGVGAMAAAAPRALMGGEPAKIQKEVDQGARYSHWCLKCDENLHHTYNNERNFAAYFDPDQIYDLSKDPREQRNLAGKPGQADRLGKMKEILKEYCEKLPHTYGELKPAGD